MEQERNSGEGQQGHHRQARATRRRRGGLAGQNMQVLQGIIDGLSAHIAVLDRDGTVVAVNESWRQFGRENGYQHPECGVGENYFDVCEAATGEDQPLAQAALAGIREVSNGQREEFTLEYPCHGPARPLWFSLRVTRFDAQGASYLVLAHQNITKGRLAEIALRGNETYLRAIIEHATDAIYIKDAAGHYLLINSATTTAVGRPAQEIIGKRDDEIFGPKIGQQIMVDDQEIMRSRQPTTYERTLNISGTPQVWFTSKAPLLSDQGELLGIIGITRDVTRERQTEEAHQAQEAMFRAVVDTSPDIITILDTDGRIKFASPAVRDLLGYEPADLHGRDPIEFVHPEDQQSIAAIRAGEVDQSQVRFRYRHADGHWVVLESHGRQMTNARGQSIGRVSVARDVTQQERLIHALRQATEEAQRANAAKSQFLSRMSHELRTPLNAILGFAQVLEMEELTPQQNESLQYIRKGGEHLLGLINEVLDIARIEVGRMTLSLEAVALSETVPEVLQLVKRLADERSVQLPATVNCPQFVLADAQRLKQVLLNLLSNAIKYNREGGSVTIECVEKANGRIQVRVTDTGPGIAPDKLQQLFVPFERLGADRKGVEGTGLGLSLSKALIEVMRGSIGVESSLGQGSTFWIELPQTQPRPEHSEERLMVAMEHLMNTQAQCTVLYVEDNLSNLALVQRILERRPGIKLLAAMQGGLGLDLAREHRPDLILIDLHLPDMSGSELLRRLQDDPRTAHIPVVVISADAIPSQIQRLLAAGARAYITKPLDVQQFLAIITELLPNGGR